MKTVPKTAFPLPLVKSFLILNISIVFFLSQNSGFKQLLIDVQGQGNAAQSEGRISAAERGPRGLLMYLSGSLGILNSEGPRVVISEIFAHSR